MSMRIRFLISFFVLVSVSTSYSQISIAVGGSLSHAVVAGPAGVCGWGQNGVGQIGDASTTNRKTPVAVSITGTITKVVAGKSTTLFLKSNGQVWGCGYNEVGQLGLGAADNRSQHNTPVQIMAGTTFTDIAVGCNQDHCLLLKNDGKVYAFGRNNDGELGTGPDGLGQYNSNATFGCPPPSTFCHACTASGAATNCEWGATANDLTAQPLWSGVCSAVWAGSYSSFFKKTDGTIWACGDNTSGQLGNGSTTTPTTGPVSIGTFAANTVSKISVGNNHTLFLKTDGTVWATGSDAYGQLGDGTTTNRSTPIQCSGLPAGTYIDIAAGAAYSIFLRNDGNVYVCGDNLYGQLGNAAAFPTSSVASPTLLATISGVAQIATGSTSQSITIFLKSDKTVWSAGYNVNGELGDGSTTGGPNNGKSTPVQVSTGSGCLPSILPVELLSFNASCKNGTVVCDWATASETNNDYFSIERSFDGVLFNEIGKVKGGGTSSTNRNYEFVDAELPLRSAVSFYYRLKQTDYDSKSAYYGAVLVNCSGPDAWNLFLQSPIINELVSGTLLLPAEEMITLSLTDLQGRIIKQEKISCIEGSNFFNMEFSNVQGGMYILKASGSTNSIQRKFIKRSQ